MFKNERTVVYELIDTEGKSVNKILTVFSALCKEVDFLRNEFEEEYIKTLLHYEEEGMLQVVHCNRLH